jgi:hypothetical protein
MENQDQAQVVNSPVGGEAPATPELSINDLQNLRAIVDTAVRRGAFSAAEISAVGSVYDRVNAFLNSVAPAQKSETAAA